MRRGVWRADGPPHVNEHDRKPDSPRGPIALCAITRTAQPGATAFLQGAGHAASVPSATLMPASLACYPFDADRGLCDSSRVLDVPTAVRNKARAVGAESWLACLPSLVEELSAEWALTLGAAYRDATEAIVAPAALADGTPAVIKLVIPRDGNAARHEITVLRLADGHGCPRLLRADPERGAMLLERLGPPLSRLGLGLQSRHEILCAAVQAFWRPAPQGLLPTGADKGRWLTDFITATWEELDRPCSEGAVALALACADSRIAAHRDERAVLVHGDVHEWNALQAERGFKLVDPDGLLAEPEYDLGVIMREDPDDLMRTDSRHRARWLADRTGLSAAAIWEWGVVERVSTGLLATRIDLQPIGAQMLAVADRIAAAVPTPSAAGLERG